MMRAAAAAVAQLTATVMGMMTAVTLSRVQLLLLLLLQQVGGHLLLLPLLPVAGVGRQPLLLLLMSQTVMVALKKGRVTSMRQLMKAVVRKQIQERVVFLLLQQRRGHLLCLSVS
jgi:hypothetical protein